MDSIIEVAETGLPKPNCDYITDEASALKAMEYINRFPEYSIDTETTALDPYEAKWSLLQIGVQNKSFVFDLRYDTEFSSVHPSMVAPVLQDASKLKLLQNAAYDMKIIKLGMGFYLENVYDTMLSEQLMHLGLFTRAGLDVLVKKYLGLHMPKEPRDTFANYYQGFQQFQIDYAANDVVVLPMIKDMQLPNLTKEGLLDAADLEFRFLKPLCEMELNGIKVDTNKWQKIMEEVDKERFYLKKEIQDMLAEYEDQQTLFGVSIINIDSNAQLKKALQKYGLALESTDVGELSRHEGLPVIDAILDYRKANKLISTYAETLLAKISSHTGRLHTSFKQMVSTGRMSSSNPNLQNIPNKQKFRSCFVASEGYSLVTSDLSGCELRILGNLSKDPIFIEAYATGQDLHTRTASEIFGVPYDKVKSEMRKAAKAINFGLCITEDTNIITDYGIKKISEVSVGDLVAHDIGENTVIDKAYMGEKEVFELETEYGYVLECTEDHFIKIIDSDGNYVDKKIEDLDLERDLVCIKKGASLFNEGGVVFDPFSICKNTNYEDFDLPTVLDENWSAFLGIFVAEGSVLKVKGIDSYSSVSFGFSKDNEEFILRIDTLFDTLFGDRVSTPKDKYKRYTINSVLFANWLANICNINGDNKTNNIRVPDCIKKSSRICQISFLKYLFEGDGTVKSVGDSSCKISYSSNSRALVRDVQLLLLNFGILSSITEETRGGKGGYYVLSVVGEGCALLFKEQIGFLTEEKNSKITFNTTYNTSYYFIGAHEKRMERIIKSFSPSKQIKDRFYRSRYGDSIGNIYLKELSKYDNFFKLIYDNGIVPLPIKSIAPKGIKRVYDLSIENHQYFLANGFVVHNCYGMSPVGLSRRLGINKKEAEQMISSYFGRYKGIKKFLDNAAASAVRNRFSTTVSGRKRYYNMPPFDHPDRKKIQGSIERQGMNANVQGANADLVKEAMCLVVDRLAPYDARLLLTVHDEVVVEVKDEQKYEVAKIVEQSMKDGFNKFFSLIKGESDCLIGPCWLKDSCENEVAGEKKCGNTEMVFVSDDKYGSRLICKKCGAKQE